MQIKQHSTFLKLLWLVIIWVALLVYIKKVYLVAETLYYLLSFHESRYLLYFCKNEYRLEKFSLLYWKYEVSEY